MSMVELDIAKLRAAAAENANRCPPEQQMVYHLT